MNNLTKYNYIRNQIVPVGMKLILLSVSLIKQYEY